MVEHADDLARLVAHNLILLLVEERGDREAAFVVGVDVEVDVAEVREGLAVQRVGRYVVAGELFVFLGEAPS